MQFGIVLRGRNDDPYAALSRFHSGPLGNPRERCLARARSLIFRAHARKNAFGIIHEEHHRILAAAFIPERFYDIGGIQA